MPLNFVCPSLQVVIENGMTSFDITKLIDNFSISRPRVEPTTPYSWTGNMVLATPIYSSHLPHKLFLYDLHPGNPYKHFWLRGNSRLIFFIKNKKLCTLRIQDYYCNEEDESIKAEIGLTDILGILDFKSPAKDYKGMNFDPCRHVTVNEVLGKIFSDSGISQNASHSFSIGGVTAPLVPPDKPSGSWIKYAQSYLGERGYFLYVTPDEVISAIKYNGNKLLFRKSRQEVENYKREKSPQLPANKYIVTGVINQFSDCSKEDGKPKSTETFTNTPAGAKVLDTRQTVKISYAQGIKYTTTTTERAIAVVMPNLDPENTQTIIASQSIKQEHYDSQGRLNKSVEIINKLGAVALPEVFDNKDIYDFLAKRKEEESDLSNDKLSIPYDSRALQLWGEAEKIEEYYSNNLTSTQNTATQGSVEDDGVIRRKDYIRSGLFVDNTYAVQTIDGEVPLNNPNFYRLIQEKITETWDDGKNGSLPVDINSSDVPEYQSPCNCEKYEYKKLTYQREQKKVSALDRYFVEVNNKYTEDTPYWEYTVLTLKDKEENNTATPPGWNKKDAECPLCQSSVKTTAFINAVGSQAIYEKESETNFSTLSSLAEAKQYASLLGDLAQQRYFSRNINLPILDEYLNDPSPFSKVDVHDGRYIMDAPNVIYTEDEMELSFIGNYLGYIDPVPSPAPITIPSSGFAIAVDNTSSYVDSFVYIPVYVFRSTGNVVLSSTSLPVGLYIEGFTIRGFLDVIGSYNIEITATDSANNIASKTFTINVGYLPTSIPDNYVSECLINKDTQYFYCNVFLVATNDIFIIRDSSEMIIESPTQPRWTQLTLSNWQNLSNFDWGNLAY